MSRDPLELARRSPLSFILIGTTIIYVGMLLLAPSEWLAGDPVWAIQPETLQEIIDESINFFFVLPLLNRIGFSGMQAPIVQPLMQAFFNFAEAWIFMFLPLLLLDPRGGRLPRVVIWSLAMFLTNVFLMPYMAARLLQPLETAPAQSPTKKGNLAKAFGLVGLLVGGLAIAWPLSIQPDMSSVAERWAFFGTQVASDRVTLAFCIDLVLFYIFQIWLMGAVIPHDERVRTFRFIPFWGLGLWLLI